MVFTLKLISTENVRQDHRPVLAIIKNINNQYLVYHRTAYFTDEQITIYDKPTIEQKAFKALLETPNETFFQGWLFEREAHQKYNIENFSIENRDGYYCKFDFDNQEYNFLVDSNYLSHFRRYSWTKNILKLEHGDEHAIWNYDEALCEYLCSVLPGIIMGDDRKELRNMIQQAVIFGYSLRCKETTLNEKEIENRALDYFINL